MRTGSGYIKAGIKVNAPSPVADPEICPGGGGDDL